jgi:hypothetical protein
MDFSETSPGGSFGHEGGSASALTFGAGDGNAGGLLLSDAGTPWANIDSDAVRAMMAIMSHR